MVNLSAGPIGSIGAAVSIGLLFDGPSLKLRKELNLFRPVSAHYVQLLRSINPTRSPLGEGPGYLKFILLVRKKLYVPMFQPQSYRTWFDKEKYHFLIDFLQINVQWFSFKSYFYKLLSYSLSFKPSMEGKLNCVSFRCSIRQS